jgi:hypothetical protein
VGDKCWYLSGFLWGGANLMEFEKYVCMQVKLKPSKAALNSKNSHFLFYLHSSTQPSLVVILLVKILELIHVLLVNTIDLAILVFHFSRLT